MVWAHVEKKEDGSWEKTGEMVSPEFPAVFYNMAVNQGRLIGQLKKKFNELVNRGKQDPVTAMQELFGVDFYQVAEEKLRALLASAKSTCISESSFARWARAESKCGR